MPTDEERSLRIRRVTGRARERLQYVASLMRDKRMDDARDELLAILHEDEKFILARMMLGGLYMAQQLHTDAFDQFKYAIDIDPLQVQPHIRAGMCCFLLNDLDQARSLLQTALDLDPKQAAAHAGMAQVLAKTDQVEQAISHLEEALRLDPQMTTARMLLAQLLSQSGDDDGAVAELADFVQTNPDNVGLSVQLALLEAKKGNHEKAIALVETVLKANPQARRLWGLLGTAKMETRDYAGAEAAFAKALELNPGDAGVSLNQVGALIKQGKLDQARDILQKVPRVGPLASLAQKYYGDLYAARQQYDEAVASYLAAILQTADGETIVAEVESAAGAGADNEAKIPHFEAAIEKVREQAIAKAREEARKARQADRGGIAAGRTTDLPGTPWMGLGRAVADRSPQS
jgi:tetratricopeptide (TPR) repeat protein